MITESQQIKLKNILGSAYSEEVISILEEKGIRNKNGHPHSQQYVLQVFCGSRNNTDVENAIYELAEMRLAEKKRKQQILDKAS